MINFIKSFNSVILGLLIAAIVAVLIWCFGLPLTSILEVVGLIAVVLVGVALIALLIFTIVYIWYTEMIEEVLSK